MPIPAQTIIDKMKSALDAEGQGDRYRFDRDFKPAINHSIDWAVSLVNITLGSKKIGEEIFRELTKVKVFQTNQYSRFQMDPTLIGHEIWTVLAIYPKPIVYPAISTVSCSASNIFTDGDNGTMEADITGLNTSVNDALIRSSAQAFAGSFSAEYTAGVQSIPTLTGRKMVGTDTGVSITKSLVYEISARVYVPSGQALDLGASIPLIRIDADPTSTGIFSSESVVLMWQAGLNNYDEWVEIKTKATAAKSADAFPIISQSLWISSGGGIIYVDNIVVTCVTATEDSIYFDNISYISSEYSAKRLTLEEWNENKGNPHMQGNEIFNDTGCPDLISYAYLNFADYSSLGYSTAKPEIEIRPVLNKEIVAAAYAKVPDKIIAETDNIEFPLGLINLITGKALDWVAYKQGDQTTLHSITKEDISTLIQSIL